MSSDLPSPPSRDEYVVVARRYRPQSFDELVGQGQVSQALANAINTHRVGHAYLFTGARGVGKTSAARIFAKALNCVAGPTPSPCNTCDVCEGVARGEDVDVLEIDGASNRGIDEIRQLRSNANIRPSRARFKIYIIDEVHMLTVPAFNALLKTLEEPPEHVKFIFCTTDPEKIPITVLSRCQRFDFPPVETASIVERLRFIVEAEGAKADVAALELLARRAGGSMRDSQSLLEQLLAFCDGAITADHVHHMLGTAQDGRLGEIAASLLQRDAAAGLRQLDEAVAEGVDAGQLAEQLLGYFRDMLAASVGCDAELMLHIPASQCSQLAETGRSVGIETLLAILQILDHAISRMRQSTHSRVLLEIALVRIAALEDLDELARLVAGLQGGAAPSSPAPRPRPISPPAQRAPAVEKKTELTTPADGASAKPASPAVQPPADLSSADRTSADRSSAGAHLDERSAHDPESGGSPAAVPSAPNPPAPDPPDSGPTSPDRAEPSGSQVPQIEISADAAESIWRRALKEIEDVSSDYGTYYERVAISAPNRLVVSFPPRYNLQKERCERPQQKAQIEAALTRVAGRTIRVDFQLSGEQDAVPKRPKRPATMQQRQRETEKHPLVQAAIELFDAEVVRVDEPRPKADSRKD